MSWEIRQMDDEFTAAIYHDGVHIATIEEDEGQCYDNGCLVVRYVVRGRDIKQPFPGQRFLSSRVSLTSPDIITAEQWSPKDDR